MRRAAATALFTLALAGCGGGAGDRADAPTDRLADARADGPPAPRERGPKLRVEPARCPEVSLNCSVATGRVLYVEAVDPDGDGDAHFVLASGDSITAPGISVIDVAARLRPDPLARTGDLVSAAGPVYRGSHGQRQIEATVLNVARAR